MTHSVSPADWACHVCGHQVHLPGWSCESCGTRASDRLYAAYADFTARVVPAARKASRTARDARAVDLPFTAIATRAADAADAAAGAANAVAAVNGVDEIDLMEVIRPAVMYAAQAASEAAAAVNAVGWRRRHMRVVRANTVRCERGVSEAVDAAYAMERASAAREPEAVRAASDAAVLALQTVERWFFVWLANDEYRFRTEAGGMRPPGGLTRRLLRAGCALLPAGDRGRYAEEWLSLLTELPTRRARATQLVSILRGAPRQAWTLRRPLKSVPPA